MNATNFFNSIRTSLFNGELAQSQVDGINALITSFTTHGGTDMHKLAYILGTVYHEAGRGMTPVREGFAHTNEQAIQYVTELFNAHRISTNYGLPDPATGQSYYGRGFVQITWKGNYRTFARLLNIDLVGNPDLALDVATSAEIAVIGMFDGCFTGKKLQDYFNDQVCDYVNARRIINGTDQAQTIAGYAQHFYNAIIS